MEKFAVDLDKVLDEFEFNEGNFYNNISIDFPMYTELKKKIDFSAEREQLQASISNGRHNIIPTAQVIFIF